MERLFSSGRPGLACLLVLVLASSASASAEPAAGTPAGAAPVAVSSPPSPAAPAPATKVTATVPAGHTALVPPPIGVAAPASPLNPMVDEFPKTEPPPGPPELDALMSQVAALRSRIAALTATLFSSKLRIELGSLGDTMRLKSLSVSLDGGVLYVAPRQASFERPEVIYEHAVAPGPHVLAVEVERHDLRQPQFSTWQLTRFVVVVPEKRTLWTRVELEEESSMGEDFAEDAAGQYELRVRLQAEVSE
jgi:hypothetical protein